jgi:CBS domain-containing protein
MGIVTDRDIVVRAVAEGKNPLDLTAEEVMSQGPISVRQDSSVEECEREMQSHQVRRILVVDKSGSCVGIVSLGDIALHRGGQETVEVVGEISRPSSPDR